MVKLYDTLHESILEAGKAINSRYGVTFFLDSVEGVVKPWLEIGAGIPKQAYNDVWVKIFTAPADAISEAVIQTLLKLEDRLVDDCQNNFQKIEWDGHNYVGVWKDKPDYSMMDFEIPCYWDPSDWFDAFDIQRMKEKWQSSLTGLTPDEIIDEEYLGAPDWGMVDREEAIEWLQSLIKEWEEEEE